MSARSTPPREEAGNSRLAMASLLIGAISQFGVLPIFGGAIAILLGTIAKSEIMAAGGLSRGRGWPSSGKSWALSTSSGRASSSAVA